MWLSAKHLSHWNVLLVVNSRVLRYTNTMSDRNRNIDRTRGIEHQQVRTSLTTLIYKCLLQRHKTLKSQQQHKTRAKQQKKNWTSKICGDGFFFPFDVEWLRLCFYSLQFFCRLPSFPLTNLFVNKLVFGVINSLWATTCYAYYFNRWKKYA